MAIWDYSCSARDALISLIQSPKCVYCKNDLHPLEPITDEKPWGDSEEHHVIVCQVCGWWKVNRFIELLEGSLVMQELFAAAGSLKPLDLTDTETPIEEVRKYLAARYEKRHDLHPKVFEQTVASVYKDFGYNVLVTGRSGDNGIDVILTGKTEDVIVGIQVKKYKNVIEVAQIRELIGALVIGSFTKGIFVTTSRFTTGAVQTVERAASAGFEIVLVDGTAFYDALQIAQRNTFVPPNTKDLIQKASFSFIRSSGVQNIGIGDYMRDMPH